MDKYIGKRLDGRYEIKEIIGVGGMAYVYKAHDNIDDRVVAVKILKEEFMANEEFTRRFKNESKAIAILSHPNIVKVYDVSFGERLQYIVMEYIDGITLKEYIEQQPNFKWKEAVHFTVQILKALQHAHDKGIVHRDIKPQNIMLLPDGTIKVTDFGIARFSRQDLHATRSSEKAIGSVHYISPEQARGEVTDEKADIYSVGVMLYEMLTGQLPFEAENAVSVAIMQLQSEAKPPREVNPSIPEGLEEITVKAMQKDPSKRYQSAAEMLYDIDEFKKNPSIRFEYEYFVDDSPTRYMDTISEVREKSEPLTGEEEEDNGKKPFPLIPVLCAVAGAFILVAIVFVGIILSNKLGSTTDASQIEVPKFIGMTLTDISENPEYFQWFQFDDHIEMYDDAEAGTVLDQSIEPGLSVKKGTKTITLTVSKGPNKIRIPDVVGLPYAQAEAALKNAGFVVKFERDVSETVPEGNVISLSPAEYPDELNYGTEITAVVSSGNIPTGPIDVPNVVGLGKDQAVSLLISKGFVVSSADIEIVNTTEAPAGTVLWQSISDTKVTAGTTIQLRVSSGLTQMDISVPLPASSVLADMQVFVNGELRSTFTGILPNEMKVKTITLSEKSGSYTVIIKLAKSGTNSADFKEYAKYAVNAANQTVSEVFRNTEVLSEG